MLRVENLVTRFHTYDGVVRALEGVSFEVREGEIFGLVGETGCGKSVTTYSTLRLLPSTGRVHSGRITLSGESLLDASESRMREVRGGEIAMIFQDPLSALNPVMRVGDQIAESVWLHDDLPDADAVAVRVEEVLGEVRMPDPAGAARAFPHELSGACSSG